jgi:hypothetical protein
MNYYTNLNKNRKTVLYLLTNRREYFTNITRPHLMRCKRGLNRYSTKQLVAKIKAFDKTYSRAVNRYVTDQERLTGYSLTAAWSSYHA